MTLVKRIITLCILSILMLSLFLTSCGTNQSYTPTALASATTTYTITASPTITFTPSVTPTPISDVSSVFLSGVLIVPGEDGDIQPGLVRQSLTKIRDQLRGTSIIIAVQWFQEDLNSSEIRPLYDRYPATISDDRLAYLINVAHEMGFRVMLYPTVGVETFWDLTPHPLEQSWVNIQPTTDEWWDGYSKFIYHYASFAQDNHVEYFFAHAELPLTMADDTNWESILKGVNQLFDGPIGASLLPDWRIGTYDVYYPWIQGVDFIGLGFGQGFETGNNDMGVQQMISVIESVETFDMKSLIYIEGLHTKYNKPIIFTEVLNPSYDGATASGFALERMESGDVTPDLQEQADFFEAFFRSFYSKPYVSGVFVGDWFLEVPGGCRRYEGWSIGLDVVDKPAASVINHWFSQTERQTASPLPLRTDGHVETDYTTLQDWEDKLDYPCHHVPPIVIDGELGDWADFSPLITDPVGDNDRINTPKGWVTPDKSQVSHEATDLVALYAYRTSENLVLAFEGASGLNRELNYMLDLDVNGDFRGDAQVFIMPPYHVMDWSYSGGDKTLDTKGFGHYSEIGDVLELAIPLEIFGYPQSISIKNISNCYCYQPNWEIHDYIGTPNQWYTIP